MNIDDAISITDKCSDIYPFLRKKQTNFVVAHLEAQSIISESVNYNPL
ncbi:MAG: hypothetical protein ACRC0J_05800 [Shewanella oncorhynchi]